MAKESRDKSIGKDNKIKNISFKIGMLLLTFSFLIPGSFAADVTLPNKIITSGQSFDLNVNIDPGSTSIAGAQLDIAFNRSILRINRITEGNLFKQKEDSTFFNGGIISNSSGKAVNIFDAIIGKSGVSTPGTFIIINMTAIGSTGTSRIDLSNVKISDPNGKPVVLNLINGSVRINSPPVMTLAPVNGSKFNETDSIKINIRANDPDKDPLTYFIKIDGKQVSTSLSYNWITNYKSAGYHTIVASVTDGKATVNRKITIYINNIRPRHDVNNNGKVDIADLVITGQHFKENTGINYPGYDVNKDGVVNIADITIISQNLGELK